MSSNIDARISTAHLELSKAQSQLSKKDIDKLLNDFGNELTISSNGLGLMAEKLSSSNKKIGKAGGIVLFVGTTIGNIYVDSSMGESGWKQFWGIVGDGATAMAMAFIPGIGWTTLALKYSVSTALSMLNLDAS